ncbi:MAG: hypothetical protein IKG70_06375 [Lachnospiraceae bacterium]|nr:hypothetical protein [Lachnospiraceae bacterium]
MDEKVILKVRNPRSELKIDEPHALPPRLDSMDGKRIAVLMIKPDANIYLEYLTQLLKEKYPTSEFVRLDGRTGKFVTIHDLPEYDAFIYGVKNTAGFNSEQAIEWEQKGTPGVTLTTAFCEPQTPRHAMSACTPIRTYVVPCDKWFDVHETDDFYKLAVDSVDGIVHALTDPLTEEEKNPKKLEYDLSDLEFEGADYTEAYDKFQTYFMDHKFTDGLAVAPPTQEAVDKMLTGTTRKPDEVIDGEGCPTHGIVTIEKIAINAVMAGAKPEYLPVIITAYEMLCDTDFDAFHPLATVTSSQLMIAVDGPIAKEIGMNCKTGYLGPGTQANSAIGRAVSLCAINLGWLDFDIDGGMTGQPSRYCNLIFCENEEESPWEPFRVTMGYDEKDSIVTIEEVMHVDGYWWADITNMPSGSVWTYGLKNDLDRVAERAQGTLEDKLHPDLENINKINFYDKWGKIAAKDWIGGKTYVILMYPGQARQLAAAGYTKEDVLKYIGNYRRWPWEKLDSDLQASMLELAKSGKMPNLTVDDCKPGGSVPVCNTDKMTLYVTGPLGGQTLGFFCMGSYKSFGANPPKVPFFSKKITGATLTESGR